MIGRGALAALLALGASACDRGAAERRTEASSVPAGSVSGARGAELVPDAPRAVANPSTSASAAAPRPVVGTRVAPSLAMSAAIDARDRASLERCESLRTGQARRSLSCGEGASATDLERFRAAALPLDEATRAHVVEVAKRGVALGRNPRSFGLVGDSITVSRDFLWAFSSASRGAVSVDPELAPSLALPSGTSVIDFFRGSPVESRDGVPHDPFSAFRAAKVGARAPWATEGGEASPVARLVTSVNPAIAVVSYGANDAAFRTAPPEELADEFERGLVGVVRELEARGVVVVVENEMRHGDQPGIKACPADDPMVNDWRLAVCTNANAARAAEIALRDHLPFVDVRYALDAATNRGLGPDGVHLSVYGRGGGVLTREGLDCGYNIRSLVTLLELRQVVGALEEEGVFARYDSSSHTTEPTR